MNVFKNYASYYDLLYHDKDYAEEASFVNSLIGQYSNGAASILEMGCGTGGHAEHFAGLGFTVYGLDISEDMLRMAEKRHAGFPLTIRDKVKFMKGDIRSVRLGQKFDVVLSLFHVMSYQTSNEDILAALKTARAHLNKGGIFIFDCWYGPAVLTDRPEKRFKELEDEDIHVSRTAQPTILPNKNLVEVEYQVSIKNKKEDTVNNLTETHKMRYLFYPEVEYFLSTTGFKLLSCGHWMTDQNAGFDTWYVCFVAESV